MAVKIGFIGAGRMAGAMIKGLIAREVYTADQIVACAPTKATRERIAAETGIQVFGTAAEAAEAADILVLAIKPKNIPPLFTEEKLRLTSRHLLISIAAGVKIETLNSYVPECRIVRVMPNHCCMVLEGAAGFVMGPGCTAADKETTERILSAIGLAVEVRECDLDAVTGICGSSPAFLYMAVEALADAGVLHGLSREAALTLAAQSMVGAGQMVLNSGMTPEQLIDGVCSPGGTTIEGVKVLQEENFKNVMIDAVNATVKRSEEMGRQ